MSEVQYQFAHPTASSSMMAGLLHHSSSLPEPSPFEKKAQKLPFPFVLYDMIETLESTGLQDVVSWTPDGKAFRVHDIDQFVEEVMPRYFTSNKFKSFTRQLYLYGFKRMENGAYYNPTFVRGKRTNCFSMKRVVTSGKLPKRPKKKASRGSDTDDSSSRSSSMVPSQVKRKMPLLHMNSDSTAAYSYVNSNFDGSTSYRRESTESPCPFEGLFDGPLDFGNLEEKFQAHAGRSIQEIPSMKKKVFSYDPSPALKDVASSSAYQAAPQSSSGPIQTGFFIDVESCSFPSSSNGQMQGNLNASARESSSLFSSDLFSSGDLSGSQPISPQAASTNQSFVKTIPTESQQWNGQLQDRTSSSTGAMWTSSIQVSSQNNNNSGAVLHRIGSFGSINSDIFDSN